MGVGGFAVARGERVIPFACTSGVQAPRPFTFPFIPLPLPPLGLPHIPDADLLECERVRVLAGDCNGGFIAGRVWDSPAGEAVLQPLFPDSSFKGGFPFAVRTGWLTQGPLVRTRVTISTSPRYVLLPF